MVLADLPAPLALVLQGAAVVALAVVGSLVLSFWMDDFKRLGGQGAQGLRTAAGRLVQAAADGWARGGELWKAWQAPLARPIARELAHLGAVVERAGERQLERLERLQQALEAARAPAPDVRKPPAAPPADEPPSLVAIALLVGFIGVFGFVNFWLLKVFFLEVIGGDPILTQPFLLYPGHVVAVLFPILEIAAGFALFLFHREEPEWSVERFFWVCAAAGIASLALIEMVAYAVLSRNANLAVQLGLDPGHAFHLPVLYALAPFGAVITVLLAALTHEACSLSARHRRARRLLARRRVPELAELARRSTELEAEVRGLSASLAEQLHRAFPAGTGADDKAALLAVVRARQEALLDGTPDPSPAIAHLAHRQAWLHLGQLLAWTACGTVVYLFVASASWRGSGSRWAAAAVALAFALLVTTVGLLAYGDVYGRAPGVRRWRDAPGRGWMRMVAWVGLLAVALLAGALMGASSRLFAWHPLVSAAAGALVMLGLALLSCTLGDAAYVVPLLAAGAVRSVQAGSRYVAATTLHVLALLLVIVVWAGEVLVVPGATLRRGWRERRLRHAGPAGTPAPPNQDRPAMPASRSAGAEPRAPRTAS